MATKYVCDGALCMCDSGNAVGILEVKSQSTVFIQEKLMATDEEKTFTAPFFGNCSKQNNKPCTPNIITKWEKPATNVNANNKKALLETSTLKCEFKGEIMITDPLQNGPKKVVFDAYVPPTVTPLTKEIVSVNWKNADLDQDIDTAYIGDKVSLVVKTKNYAEGETVVVVIDEVDGKDVKTNTKLIKFSGEVNADGLAILKEEIAIETVN